MRFNASKFKVAVAQNAMFVALVLLIVLFSLLGPRFLSPENINAILSQIAELGIIALAMAFLLMMGSVDLSVGSVAACAAVIAGLTMQGTGDVLVGVIAGIGFGVFAGIVNGVLVAFLKLNALVVTIGFLSAWSGLAFLLTNGQTISGLPQSFTAFSQFRPLGVPIQVLLLLVAIVVAWWLLNRAAVGRQVLATGGNERAAYLMGVRVRAIRFVGFVVTGAVAALVGLMLGAKLHAFSPGVGAGLEISVLIVVLLGGVAFDGGSGRISGVVVGLVFYGVLRNGLQLLGVPGYLQTFLIGLTLVLAVAVDGSIQRLVRTAWASGVSKVWRAPVTPVAAEKPQG